MAQPVYSPSDPRSICNNGTPFSITLNITNNNITPRALGPIGGGTQIELLGYNKSQLFEAKPGLNTYLPLGITTPNPLTVLNSALGATHYLYGYFFGVMDAFTNAGGVVPTGDTKDVVYIDPSGTLVYQQGYVAGAATATQCTVTTNTSTYGEFFRWSGTHNFVIVGARVNYNATNQFSSQIIFQQYNIQANTQKYTTDPQNFKSPLQFQSLEADCLFGNDKQGVLMTPDWAIQYNAQLNNAGAAAPGVISMTMSCIAENTRQVAGYPFV